MGCCNSSVKIQPDSNQEWDYSNTSLWSIEYPSAKGKNQSPINIISSLCEYDESLISNPFEINFDLNCFIELKNNGHTFEVSAATDTSSVSGGLLPNSYKFAQFHMHWGLSESSGSEHFVDGSSFAAELHFVYWNDSKYSCFETAAQSTSHDGLAVFAVFVIIGEENNEFNKITAAIDYVKLKNQSTFVSRPIELKKFFPDNTSKYWAYLGSLTTPPCTESTLWAVFHDPIQISIRQLNKVKQIYSCIRESDCTDSKRIKTNHRFPCELNERKIIKSFE